MLPRLPMLLLGVLTVLYPAVVYFGMRHFAHWHLAALLGVLAVARALLARQLFWWAAAGLSCVLAGLSAWGDAWLPLKLYPTLVSVGMFAWFALSLWRPPSAIERLARWSEPDLPPEAVGYTRRVTQIWCVFFVFNGTVATATALWGSDDLWALYTGFLSYVLMGMLFGCEWLVRRRVRARSRHDRMSMSAQGDSHGR